MLTAAVPALAACGGAATPPESPTAASGEGGGPRFAEVAVRGDAFKPNSLRVTVGTTVTWTNTDAHRHTVVAGQGNRRDSRWRGGSLGASGGKVVQTFAEAGLYPYFCSFHGMTGVVDVR